MDSPPQGLTVEKIHVWRGDRHVLKGVSLALGPGELLQVAGPNGTGKTTLLRVACGLLRPEQGRVAWWPAHCGHPSAIPERPRLCRARARPEGRSHGAGKSALSGGPEALDPHR